MTLEKEESTIPLENMDFTVLSIQKDFPVESPKNVHTIRIENATEVIPKDDCIVEFEEDFSICSLQQNVSTMMLQKYDTTNSLEQKESTVELSKYAPTNPLEKPDSTAPPQKHASTVVFKQEDTTAALEHNDCSVIINDQSSIPLDQEYSTFPLEIVASTVVFHKNAPAFPLEDKASTMLLQKDDYLVPLVQENSTFKLEQEDSQMTFPKYYSTIPLGKISIVPFDQKTSVPSQKHAVTVPLEGGDSRVSLSKDDYIVQFEEENTTSSLEQKECTIALQQDDSADILQQKYFKVPQENYDSTLQLQLQDSTDALQHKECSVIFPEPEPRMVMEQEDSPAPLQHENSPLTLNKNDPLEEEDSIVTSPKDESTVRLEQYCPTVPLENDYFTAELDKKDSTVLSLKEYSTVTSVQSDFVFPKKQSTVPQGKEDSLMELAQEVFEPIERDISSEHLNKVCSVVSLAEEDLILPIAMGNSSVSLSEEISSELLVKEDTVLSVSKNKSALLSAPDNISVPIYQKDSPTLLKQSESPFPLVENNFRLSLQQDFAVFQQKSDSSTQFNQKDFTFSLEENSQVPLSQEDPAVPVEEVNSAKLLEKQYTIAYLKQEPAVQIIENDSAIPLTPEDYTLLFAEEDATITLVKEENAVSLNKGDSIAQLGKDNSAVSLTQKDIAVSMEHKGSHSPLAEKYMKFQLTQEDSSAFPFAQEGATSLLKEICEVHLDQELSTKELLPGEFTVALEQEDSTVPLKQVEPFCENELMLEMEVISSLTKMTRSTIENSTTVHFPVVSQVKQMETKVIEHFLIDYNENAKQDVATLSQEVRENVSDKQNKQVILHNVVRSKVKEDPFSIENMPEEESFHITFTDGKHEVKADERLNVLCCDKLTLRPFVEEKAETPLQMDHEKEDYKYLQINQEKEDLKNQSETIDNIGINMSVRHDVIDASSLEKISQQAIDQKPFLEIRPSFQELMTNMTNISQALASDASVPKECLSHQANSELPLDTGLLGEVLPSFRELLTEDNISQVETVNRFNYRQVQKESCEFQDCLEIYNKQTIPPVMSSFASKSKQKICRQEDKKENQEIFVSRIRNDKTTEMNVQPQFFENEKVYIFEELENPSMQSCKKIDILQDDNISIPHKQQALAQGNILDTNIQKEGIFEDTTTNRVPSFSYEIEEVSFGAVYDYYQKAKNERPISPMSDISFELACTQREDVSDLDGYFTPPTSPERYMTPEQGSSSPVERYYTPPPLSPSLDHLFTPPEFFRIDDTGHHQEMSVSPKTVLPTKQKAEENFEDLNFQEKLEALRDVSAVESPPAFIKPIGKISVIEGGTFRLLSQIVSVPSPEVLWYKGTSLVQEKHNVTIEQDGDIHYLEVKNSRLSDSGEYTCLATNKVGEAMTHVTVEVLEYSTNQNDSIPFEAQEHIINFNIDQNEHSRSPSPQEILLEVEMEEQDFDAEQQIKMITFPELSEDGKRMMISLEVFPTTKQEENVEISAELAKAIDINVKMSLMPPMFVNRIMDLHVPVGTKALFHCMIAGMPIPIVTWYKNGEILSFNHIHYTFTADDEYYALEINDVILSDTGIYCCKASNAVGETSSKASLDVTSSASLSIAHKIATTC